VNRHVSVLSIVLVFALAVASAAQSATTSPSQEVSVPRLVKFSGTVSVRPVMPGAALSESRPAARFFSLGPKKS